MDKHQQRLLAQLPVTYTRWILAIGSAPNIKVTSDRPSEHQEDCADISDQNSRLRKGLCLRELNDAIDVVRLPR